MAETSGSFRMSESLTLSMKSNPAGITSSVSGVPPVPPHAAAIRTAADATTTRASLYLMGAPRWAVGYGPVGLNGPVSANAPIVYYAIVRPGA